MARFLAPLVVACLASVAAAGPPADEQKLVADVNRAIDKGVQYLRTHRDATKQWEGFKLRFVGMEGGGTALATLALLNCGLKPDDKDVAGALEYLRKLEPAKTYVVALTIMSLTEARQAKDLPLVQKLVDWLIKTAVRKGDRLSGWSYPNGPGEEVDASNSQYALLGLYAGKQAGATIPDAVWKDIQALYLGTKSKQGADTASWKYSEAGRHAPSFTMTAAGVSGLVIAGMGLDASEQQLNATTGVAAKCGQYADGEPVRMGLNWIGQRFAFINAPESMSAYYNIYGLERVGRLTGQRFLGKADWYREGCSLLVRLQSADGFWPKPEGGFFFDTSEVINTSFALLFLSKGRSPVLISKLAHGDYQLDDGVLSEKEKQEQPGIVGWNRKHNDARNLTDYCARELFKGMPLGWQAYDPRRVNLQKDQDVLDEVGVLIQTPVLYFNGHKVPNLTGQQEELLRKYIAEGGFVIAEACCGSKDFADGFRKLMAKLFPNNELKPMPPEHAIWRTHFAVPPGEFKQLEYMTVGCRTVLVFSPEPLAGYWEETKYMPKAGDREGKSRGEQAFRLGANIVAYATGMEPPKQRLTVAKIVDGKELKAPPKGFIQPVQIELPGDTPPAPNAMRNLMGYVRDVAKLDVAMPEPKPLASTNPDLLKFRFMYMHGKKEFNWDTADMENVKVNLQTSGMLLADACCGSPRFDAAFRAMIEKMFADEKLKLVPIPTDDPLFSAKVNGGVAIKSVKRREKAAAAATGNDGGYEDLPPKLEGIKIDGRWVVVYSRYDIGCALENHKSTDCLGHTPESARRLAAAALLYSLKRGADLK